MIKKTTIMKKKYQKPAFDVVVIERRVSLLQSSVTMPDAIKPSYDPGDSGTWD